MRAEAEPKLHSRRNESARGAPVARSGAWVGPFNMVVAREYDSKTGLAVSDTICLRFSFRAMFPFCSCSIMGIVRSCVQGPMVIVKLTDFFSCRFS
jgi:hypothetical protein